MQIYARMEGKNKTLVSTSFDFQQIICQQLMARRWVEKNEKKIREKGFQWEINSPGKTTH